MTNEFQFATSRGTVGGATWRSERDGDRPIHDRQRARGVFARTVRDALVAFTAFGLISGTVVCLPSAASPTLAGAVLSVPAPNGSAAVATVARDDSAPIVQIATTGSSTSSNAVYRRTSDQTAYLLLAVAFSLLTALNVAFVRHLREAYAPLLRRSKSQQTVLKP